MKAAPPQAKSGSVHRARNLGAVDRIAFDNNLQFPRRTDLDCSGLDS